jgi:4-oxalocrotonate tautomerase
MPHVIVKLVPGKSEQQKTCLASEITYGEEAVSVSFEEVNPQDWAENVYQPEILQKCGMVTGGRDTTRSNHEELTRKYLIGYQIFASDPLQ